MTGKHIVVFGATGTAGRAAAAALRSAGPAVLCYGRTPPAGGFAFVPGALGDGAALRAALAGADVAVSCLASRSGAPQDAWAVDHAGQLAVLRAAQAAGVGHMISVSAICVQRPRLAFQHAKLAFEAELRGAGLRWSIVRPTAFFKSLSGQVARVQAGKPFLVFGDGRLTACKPISDCDLGRFIAGCVSDPAGWDAVLPVGGPGPAITPRDQAAMLSRLLGREVALRRVPPALLRGAAGLLRLAGRRDKAELAQIGHYYATESMLLWDGTRYSARATPAYGQDRLEDHYAAVLAGKTRADLGAHGVF